MKFVSKNSKNSKNQNETTQIKIQKQKTVLTQESNKDVFKQNNQKKVVFANRPSVLSTLMKQRLQNNQNYAQIFGFQADNQSKSKDGGNFLKSIYNKKQQPLHRKTHSQHITVVEVDKKNIQEVRLDQQISSLYSIGKSQVMQNSNLGPIFEGMPMIRYSQEPISWIKIMNDIVNFYAPKIPFQYLEKEKNKDNDEKQNTQITQNMRINRFLNFKQLKNTRRQSFSHLQDQQDVLYDERDIRIRRHSCNCHAFCGHKKQQFGDQFVFSKKEQDQLLHPPSRKRGNNKKASPNQTRKLSLMVKDHASQLRLVQNVINVFDSPRLKRKMEEKHKIQSQKFFETFEISPKQNIQIQVQELQERKDNNSIDEKQFEGEEYQESDSNISETSSAQSVSTKQLDLYNDINKVISNYKYDLGHHKHRYNTSSSKDMKLLDRIYDLNKYKPLSKIELHKILQTKGKQLSGLFNDIKAKTDSFKNQNQLLQKLCPKNQQFYNQAVDLKTPTSSQAGHRIVSPLGNKNIIMSQRKQLQIRRSMPLFFNQQITDKEQQKLPYLIKSPQSQSLRQSSILNSSPQTILIDRCQSRNNQMEVKQPITSLKTKHFQKDYGIQRTNLTGNLKKSNSMKTLQERIHTVQNKIYVKKLSRGRYIKELQSVQKTYQVSNFQTIQ